MEGSYPGPERREFVRLEHSAPIAYKICKPETLSMLLEGYTVDVSQAGLRCTINERVTVNDILWLSFDKSVLSVCSEIEHDSLIYQHGIIGKVVRIEQTAHRSFDIGVKFITRHEKSSSEIRSKTSLLGPEKDDGKKA
ncbi:MAG: PilZ domain-containing protein [Candidatus Omnitrophica bacterium]|nr:PilZ domain-containing protein [Candidatus Omnitrophota bacterium]